jgi:hypothetical protein
VEGFLPPEPPGPEPELGRGPRKAPPPPAEQAPPGTTQQTPPGTPPPAPAYAPQAVEPDNGPAVTGFVLSTVAGGLLIVTGGISSIVSLACSIFGIVYSRRGTARVREGVTTRNAGLAKAGFVIGIVAVVLSALATLVWVIVLILILSDEEFRRDFENEFDDSNSISALVRVAAVAGRALVA